MIIEIPRKLVLKKVWLKSISLALLFNNYLLEQKKEKPTIFWIKQAKNINNSHY